MVVRIKLIAPDPARRASHSEIRRLVSEVSRRNVLVKTGAGLSTESGHTTIVVLREKCDVYRWMRKISATIQYQDKILGTFVRGL